MAQVQIWQLSQLNFTTKSQSAVYAFTQALTLMLVILLTRKHVLPLEIALFAHNIHPVRDRKFF